VFIYVTVPSIQLFNYSSLPILVEPASVTLMTISLLVKQIRRFSTGNITHQYNVNYFCRILTMVC